MYVGDIPNALLKRARHKGWNENITLSFIDNFGV